MNRVLRETARLVVAAVLIVSIGSVGTAFADGDESASVELRTPARIVAVDEAAPAQWLHDNLRLTSGLIDAPAMPEEMELLSDIVTELLSGNALKLLADNCTQLLSGNAPELFSGNEAELLSGNDTRLLSGNKPELLSGNKVQLFSNINLSISITESGNNNTAPPPMVAGHPLPHPPLLHPKRPAPPAASDRPGRIRQQKQSSTKSAKKARRAKRRFAALDTNGDGQLSLEELQGRGTSGSAMAASEHR